MPPHPGPPAYYNIGQYTILFDQHPSHRIHSLCRRTLDLQPTTTLDSTPYCSTNIPHTEYIVYAAAPWTSSLLQHWTVHHIAVTTVLRSWRCAKDCQQHVEPIQRSIKLVIVASSWSFKLFTSCMHLELATGSQWTFNDNLTFIAYCYGYWPEVSRF